MSNENQNQVIQCSGCSSKLRVGASAQGKTIACPKCGQRISVPTFSVPASTQPKKIVVAAKPVTNSAAPATPTAAHNASSAPTAENSNWDPLQYVPAAPNPAYQPYGAARPAPQASSGNSRLWLWVGLGVTVSLLVLSITIGIVMALMSGRGSANTPPPTAGNVPYVPTRPGDTSPAKVNAPVAAVKPPVANAPVEFPQPSPPRPFGPNIVMQRVMIPRGMVRPLVLNIFIPKGEHAPQSLPVMFEAPSGTTLLHGAEVGFPRTETEILPFTDRGMITVTFSLDGPMSEALQPGSPIYFKQLERSYREFVQSDAGVLNGKMAIDYTLAKIPQADPKRLYMWGHSSSATLALLLAAKEPRIVKCIALAPCTDLNKRLGELVGVKEMEKTLPNLADYLKSGSPITYVNQLKCPVFVAHAQDDDNEPFDNTKVFVDALKQAGGNIKFEAHSRGGHYQELMNAALPQAYEWIK